MDTAEVVRYHWAYLRPCWKCGQDFVWKIQKNGGELEGNLSYYCVDCMDDDVYELYHGEQPWLDGKGRDV